MQKYDAHWFFKEYKNKINEKEYMWAYKNNKVFTEIVTKAINDIIEEKTDLQSQNEYFRIDVSAYRSRTDDFKSQYSGEMNIYLWDMMIAVEHENDLKDWLYEISKLTHIRCPLKVVISYNRYDERETDMDKLKHASAVLQASSTYKSMENDDEEWLVLLGNCRSKDSEYSLFDYRGYLYSFGEREFVQIT